MRKNLLTINKETALHKFGLTPDRPVVSILGGSQGSMAINGVVSSALHDLTDSIHTQIIWQTGKNHYEALHHLEKMHVGVRLFPFIKDMGSFYAASDLIISRAGAMALAEITHCGIPAILIPFPGAAADHQTENAKSLVQAGAAILIPERELTPQRLIQEVKHLLSAPQKREQMSKAAKQLAITDSADRIVEQITRLVHE